MKLDLEALRWDRLCSIFDCRQRITELMYYLKRYPYSEASPFRKKELSQKIKLLRKLENGKS